MRRIALICAFLSLCALPAVAESPGKAEPDIAAIKAAALDYALGWYTADPERMERCLHPRLAKRISYEDPITGRWSLDEMSSLQLVGGAREGWGSRTPEDVRRSEVTILDRFGDAASVRLDMHDWIDYMHLARIDGQWKIVNVLWERRPEAKQRMQERAGKFLAERAARTKEASAESTLPCSRCRRASRRSRSSPATGRT